MTTLQNETALVTGASRGIGRATAAAPESESDVEIALREALANAIIHGNHENPRKRVHVRFRCEPDEVSLAVKDEGRRALSRR